MTPRVSVVLTTYNRSEVLAETIDLILAQTFEDFELIICDDASADSTPEICREYVARDSRVRYLRHDANLGMPGNLNSGVKVARGELVANLHDGDVFDSHLLEEWVRALDACPDAAFVFNSYGVFGPDRELRRVFSEQLEPCNRGSELLKIFYRRAGFGSPVWGTVMARRTAYEEMGYFQPRFGFISDVDMWMRLAEKHSVAYVAKPLILLPTREVLPRVTEQPKRHSRMVSYRMTWESKRRWTKGRALTALYELGLHCIFVGYSEARAFTFSIAAPITRLIRRRRAVTTAKNALDTSEPTEGD